LSDKEGSGWCPRSREGDEMDYEQEGSDGEVYVEDADSSRDEDILDT
jgi:hypothetical protein